ncbi:MAG TPA: carboxypeptidase-like regulatory domain-containing protein, partial [Candidatus Acidoferrum sp.]|nr:carboxypeptidase-like regulatory domain-containing protein [Candidatus Acidoferrum sp.]
MSKPIALHCGKLALGLAAASLLLAGCGKPTSPAAAAPSAATVGPGAIGGAVMGASGPEAGVWVIAETAELGTRFLKIVVTDDQGRFLLPELPAAHYQVWVRGYGLADSAKVAAKPGDKTLALTATAAASPAEAAKVYPAAYWYSMINLPTADEVTGISGGLNGYLMTIKNMGCVGCHQLGQLATRTLPPAFSGMDSAHEAWVRRTQSGQAGGNMVAIAAQQLRGLPYKYLGEWTDRVAKGELPKTQPTRPQGIERNVVVTVRDWASPKSYLHDLSGTDRRN